MKEKVNGISFLALVGFIIAICCARLSFSKVFLKLPLCQIRILMF